MEPAEKGNPKDEQKRKNNKGCKKAQGGEYK